MTQDQHSTHDSFSTTIFGFWTYLMTDCVLFACLFATYAVLYKNTYGGPSGKEIFEPSFVLAETLALLVSSFASGLAVLAARHGNTIKLFLWMSLAFILGASFVAMEITEFKHLIAEGNGPARSGFLTAFFTLVGTHGLHVSVGLLWMVVLMAQIVRRGLKTVNFKRLLCLSLFWHFLDVVWIFIFTLVYMMGVK